MSMYSYSIENMGLWLDKEACKKLVEKWLRENDDEAEYEELGYDEIEEILSDSCECSMAWDLEGGIKFPITENGVDYTSGEDIRKYVILDCNRYEQIFKPAYNNIEEIVEEMKKKSFGILAEDYIRNNLCKVQGVIWG